MDGETLYLNTNGTIYCRNMTSKGETHLTIDVRNGANLIVNQFYMGDTSDPVTDDMSMALKVQDGSSFYAKSTAGLRSGNVSLDVTGSSALRTDGAFSLMGTANNYGAANCRMSLVDSRWDFYGNVNIGSDKLTDTVRAQSSLNVGFTNSVISGGNPMAFNDAKVVFKDTDLDFTRNPSTANDGYFRTGYGADVTADGGTWTNVTLHLGRMVRKSILRLKKGDFHFLGWEIGASANSDATLEVDGDDVLVRHDTTYWNTIGYQGTGTVNLVRGTVRPFTMGFIRVGNLNAGAVGTVNVSGGLWDAFGKTDSSGFYVGETGEGHVNVSGGEVRAGYIKFLSSKNNSTYRQTGGLVTLGGPNTDQGYFDLASNGKTARLDLDGGVLEAWKLYGGANAEFRADGGTLRAGKRIRNGNVSMFDPFMYDFGSAKLGAKGLRFDTAGVDVTVTQGFANKDGVEGLFEKVGGGTLTLNSAAHTVSKTVVSGGTLKYANASGAFATTLVITNGAVFSTAGEEVAVLTLNGLKVDNGRIELDPGDVITVTGAVDLKDLSLSFTSAPAEAQNFLVIDGELSDDSAAALRRALYDAEVPDGKHGRFTPTYDQGTGKTTVEFAVVDDAAELGDATEWTGSGAWATPGNWSEGVPTAARKAVFADASAARDVSVEFDAVTGAIEFGADGYAISGSGTIEIAAEQGAAHLDVTVGTNTIAAPLVLDSVTYADLDAGTELRLNGALSEGGIRKSGRGKLVLSSPSVSCPYGLSLIGGTTVAACCEALGTRSGAPNRVKVKGDTLEINEPDGEGLVFDQAVSLVATNATAAIVLKSETPATFKNLTLDAGAIVKRGKEKLTIEVRDGDHLTRGLGSITGTAGSYSVKNTLRFDEDGTAPTSGHAGLTIAEGELCVKPAVVDETPVVNAVSGIMVGERLYQGVANPTLTVDHVYFKANLGSGIKTWIGYYINEDSNVMLEPTLRVINGATYYCDSTEMGTFAYNANLAVHPTLIVEDSTFETTWALEFASDALNGDNKAIVRGKNATFIVGGGKQLSVSGETEGDFDNCLLRQTSDSAFFTLQNTSYRPGGFLRFRNGSELRANAVKFSPFTAAFKLIFDDSTWDWGGGDYALVDSDSSQFANPNLFSLEMQGKGLVVAPSANKTLTLDVPVAGAGGFVNRGAGTVKFGEGRCLFTGALVPESGTVDFSEAGTVASLTIGQGAGTIKGLTATKITLDLEVDDDGTVIGDVPVFDGGTVAKAYVSFGRDAEHALGKLPENALIARYTGGVPPAINWRKALDIGEGKASLVVTAANGEIRAMAVRTGALILVR